MEVGYTQIDTASRYDNEGVVGEALQECFAKGKKRSDLYVVTKLRFEEYSDVKGALSRQLERL